MRANDKELLQRYLRDGSEPAFAELVERYIGLVYSAALRQVDGDAQVAEEVTQAVFTDLARKGDHLLRHATLAGWLYTSTHYLAANARRAALRRRAHEQSAQIMNDLLRPNGPEQDWTALRPVLDEAMHDLNPADREAVLWRYFEKHAFVEIGARLGLNENAARMRVERALDKLRAALMKRGVTSSSMVLASLVTSQAIGSAPAGLAGRVCQTSIAAAGTAGIGTLITLLFASTKAKLALCFLTLAAVLGLVLGNWNTGVSPAPVKIINALAPGEFPDASTLRTTGNDTIGASGGSAEVAPAATASEPARLQLRLVAADTGEAVKGADVRYSCKDGSETSFKNLKSDPKGVIEIGIPNEAQRVDFLTSVEDFADTFLVWWPQRGEVIPSEYVFRLARAVPLGGLVMDANGSPVAGATVEGFHATDSLWDAQRETHVAELKAKTDANGRWQSRRMAPEVVRLLRLQASHPTHGPSEPVDVSADLDVERQLRERTHTFRLGTAAVMSGLVVDPENNPVAGAKVLLGQLYSSDAKETITAEDGSFEFAGVPPGMRLLTGDADGFATTTVEIDVRPDSKPVQLVLTRGKPLLVKVVDLAGQPIAQAGVCVDASRRNNPTGSKMMPQLRLYGKTDLEGHVLFAHVPEAEIQVGASAKGYMELSGCETFPGGPELILKLGPELVVAGTVRDGQTGELIPHFKIVTGRPEPGGPCWSTIGRFLLNFEGGSFQHSFNEAVVSEGTNAGYLLKFEADGYAPLTSRFIAADEGLVHLNITLQPSSSRPLIVLNPNGTPAAWADVGLPVLARGITLALVPGGFSRRFSRSDGALLRTDEQGRLKHPEAEISQIIAATPAGYAEVDISKLNNGIIQLQPWGRVEGDLPVHEGQNAIHEVVFQYQGNKAPNGVISDFYSAFLTKPDSSGHFVFPMAPPGHHRIAELIPKPGTATHGWPLGRMVEVEVRAGETTQVTFESAPKPN
jgi:RNA polymerase sigma factor (sigma-70 family)